MGEMYDSLTRGGIHMDPIHVGLGANLMVSAPTRLAAWELQQVGLKANPMPVHVISRAYGVAEGVDPDLEAEVIGNLQHPCVEAVRMFSRRSRGWRTVQELCEALSEQLNEELRALDRKSARWPTAAATLARLRREPMAPCAVGGDAAWTCSFRSVLSSVTGVYEGHRVHEWIVAREDVQAAWKAAVRGADATGIPCAGGTP